MGWGTNSADEACTEVILKPCCHGDVSHVDLTLSACGRHRPLIATNLNYRGRYKAITIPKISNLVKEKAESHKKDGAED